MSEIDLPESFQEWPREDRIEYLSTVGKKEDVMRMALTQVGVEFNGTNSSGLKRDKWAEILVALLEDDE